MAFRKIDISSTVAKVIAVAICIAILPTVYFVLKRTFGNTLALFALQKEVTDVAVEMAPNDPIVHHARAAWYEKSFLPADLPVSLAAYETVAALSPEDFRSWLNLSKARDRSGDAAGAEKALRKAIELAPNYSELHWVLGNQLLRRGAQEEAFLEMRRAVDNDPKFAAPAVVVAWQLLDGDVKSISNKIGDSVPIRAQLAAFLAKEKRFDEAFAEWNSLPKEAIGNYREQGTQLMNNLIASKRFKSAAALQSQLSDDKAQQVTAGQISNSGFESDINPTPGLFEWKITDGLQPQIGIDEAQKSEGQRSLVVIYNTKGGENRPVEQTVIVEPGRTYTLDFSVKAEVKTNAAIKWEITDSVTGAVLATTEPVPTSTNWTGMSVSFSTGAASEAITIKLAPATCKQSSVCPATGKVWFDKFNLR
jgi:hypothetical protein